MFLCACMLVIYFGHKAVKMYFFITRERGAASALTLNLSIWYDTPEVCYGDSKVIVHILDMTFNNQMELLSD